MAAPDFATEAAAAGSYPANRFNQRERKLLASVKTYVDSLSPDTVITTQGDIIVGNAGGDAARLAKGTSGLPLVAGASTVSYVALTDTGLASDSVTTAKIANLNVTTAKLAADAVDNTKLADDAVSLENLDSGIEFAYRAMFAGTFTTAGGDAAETIAVVGVTGTDIVVVTVKTAGATPRSIVAAAANTDAIDVTMSDDPSNDHVLQYVVFRAAS